MLKALDRLLKSEGFKVEKFSHPADFLASIGEAPCRVAILDVWMPDMNGLEVQSALQNVSPETRIIFISGRDDPSVRQAHWKRALLVSSRNRSTTKPCSSSCARLSQSNEPSGCGVFARPARAPP